MRSGYMSAEKSKFQCCLNLDAIWWIPHKIAHSAPVSKSRATLRNASRIVCPVIFGIFWVWPRRYPVYQTAYFPVTTSL
jgi:hypothetical protein